MAHLGPAMVPNSETEIKPEAVSSILNRLPSSISMLPTPILLSIPFLSFLLILLLSLPSRRSLESPHKVKSSRKKRSRSSIPTVLLIGPEQSGKTSLFSKLVLNSVPLTQTSQREATSRTTISVQSSKQEEFKDYPPPSSSSISVQLIDLPGHPRLRPRVGEYIPSADAIVFCVDATLASRGGSGNTGIKKKDDRLTDAVDQLHSALTILAKQRLSSKNSTDSPPPSVLILFTRSDLSPLLSSSSEKASDPIQKAKRKAQLLSRARSGLESELGRRRANMRIGLSSAENNSSAKIGGLDKVTGGSGGSPSPGGGLVNNILSLFGLGSKASRQISSSEDDEEGEENLDDLDYVDWNVLQSLQQSQKDMNNSSTLIASASHSFSLDKLDEDVVEGGKAECRLVSLEEIGHWSSETNQGEAEIFELKEWLVNLV